METGHRGTGPRGDHLEAKLELLAAPGGHEVLGL